MSNKIVQIAVRNFLNKRFNESIKKEDYMWFDNRRWMTLPVSVLQDKLDLTAFQQRGILSELQASGIIETRLGHARKRYVTFERIGRLDKKGMQEAIKQALPSLTVRELQSILLIVGKKIGEDNE